MYYVIFKSADGTKDDIRKIVIEDIKHDSFAHDTYLCKFLGDDFHVSFTNCSSDLDDLILDSDHAYVDNYDYKRVYTSYQGALDYMYLHLQMSIKKDLERLELIEKNLGFGKDIAFSKKTYTCKEDYRRYKKIEIYTNWDEKPKDVDKILENKKVNVYKKLIETDYYGHTKYSGEEHFVESFDTLEEALEFVQKNDKSRHEGRTDSWFEGYKYYIKD